MTRAQLVTLSQELADAVGSPRWSTANINVYLGLAQWRNIGKLLNANNQYYLNTVTPTQDADGQFDVSDLSSGSGDSAKNFYRVLTMANPNTSSGTAPLFYREAKYVQYPNPQPGTSLPYVWYRFGSKIQILPAVSGQEMSAVVNYRPPRADQLSAGSVTVEYPDGYETGLAYEAAGTMLDKGAAESDAAKELRRCAQYIMDDMLLDLGRMSTAPIIAGAMDAPADWGG